MFSPAGSAGEALREADSIGKKSATACGTYHRLGLNFKPC